MNKQLVIVEDSDGTTQYFTDDQVDLVVVRVGVDKGRANGFFTPSDVYAIFGRDDHAQPVEFDFVPTATMPSVLAEIIKARRAEDAGDDPQLALDFGADS